MFHLCGRVFRLVKVGLVRAGCPRELAALADNVRKDAPLIIVQNTRKYGFVAAADYFPAGVIVSGRHRRDELLETGLTRTWIFVEASVAGTMKMDDEILAHDLLRRLDASVSERYYGARGPVTGQPVPSVREVYPFEHRIVYAMNNHLYAQAYKIDPSQRILTLTGQPQLQADSSLSKPGFVPGMAKERMPRSDTGARYAFAPPGGQLQSYTMGGPNSELVTQIIRNWADVNEAVAMYLDYLRTARPTDQMRPAFQPVALVPATGAKWATKIANALQAKGLSPFDFAVWSAMAQDKKTKSHGGDEVPMSEHAYVGSPSDPSTWKLPIDTPGRTKNALARINQTHGVPASKKSEVLGKIRKKAARLGVDVSAPTSKQKTWMKHGGKEVDSGFLPGRIPSAGVARVGVF